MKTRKILATLLIVATMLTFIPANLIYAENEVNGTYATRGETVQMLLLAPDDYITRDQIAAIIYRYAQHKGYDVSMGDDTNILSYTDADSISEYAIPSVQYAVSAGLIKGKSEATLNSKDNATRAEIAAILHRFFEAK